MNKLVKSILVAGLMVILVTMPVFAMSSSNGLESDQQQSVVKIYDRRGNWIADGLLTITNLRNGKIGIDMSTFCHVNVDEIQMEISVEKHNGSSWEQVDYLTYNFYPTNGKLSQATVDTERACPELNKEYRLVGWHTVFVGSGSESLKTNTAGLVITNR